MQVIKDWVLLAFVAVVVTGDLIIITTGTAVPSSRLNATLIHDIQHPISVTVSSKRMKLHSLLIKLALISLTNMIN